MSKSRLASVEVFGRRLWRGVDNRLDGAKGDQSPSGGLKRMTRTGTGSGSETGTSTAATSADREKEKRRVVPAVSRDSDAACGVVSITG